MLSELQQRKLRRLFQLTDFNQDGHIQRDDYEESIKIYGQMRGISSDSEEYQQRLDVYQAEWEDLRQNADADGDGRVSFDEFLAHQERILADEDYFNQTVGKVAHVFLSTMDGDRDGKINLQEFLTGHAGFQVDVATSESIFNLINQDGDDSVTYEEMFEVVRRFYYSTDPDDPANYLMGPY